MSWGWIFFWKSKNVSKGLSKAFHYPIQLLTFYLLLWNYLLILKMLAETLLRENARELTCHWRLSVLFYLLFYRWLPVSIFSVKIAAFGSLKRVTGRIFKTSKQFQRSKKKLWFWFFHSSKKQNIVKTISACKEGTFLS